MTADDIDPRFDAAFQPGFEGKPAGRSPRSANPAKAALESIRKQPEGMAALVAEVETDEGAGPRRRVNPFLIALGILSVALIGAGVYGIGALGEAYSFVYASTSATFSQPDYTALEMLPELSALSIALGVAIGAGVLFVYAIAWQRKA